MEDTCSAILPQNREGLLARGLRELHCMRKRRSYISSPETQARVVRQFMLMLGLGVALGLANAYVLASFADLKVELLPEAAPGETAIALVYMASLLMVSVGIVLLLAVFYSHRVGGPVFKIVGGLERLADGDLRGCVQLRETDLLGDVAQAVNDAGMSIGRKVRDLDRAVVALRGCRGLPADAEACIADIEAVLRRLGATPRSRLREEDGENQPVPSGAPGP